MSEDEYLRVDVFVGDEAEYECRSAKIVTTRLEHSCLVFGPGHPIPAGSRARLEKGLVGRSFWGRYYACLPCLDRWQRIADGEEDE